MPDSPIALTVRIVRANATVPTHRGDEPEAQYLVGVTFTEFPSSAKHAIAKLCGAAFSMHE
jgi:hypothetical protein